MDTITINNTTFNDFGVNNYSCECNLVTTPNKEIMRDCINGRVQLSDIMWFGLNPSAPANSIEVYGFIGTAEQVNNAITAQIASTKAKMLLEQFDSLDAFIKATDSERKIAEANVDKNFKLWWE